MPLTTFLQKIPTLVLVFIITLLSYQLALLSWNLLPEKKASLLWKPVSSNNHKNTTQINIQQLQQQHLFGEKNTEVKTVVGQKTVNNAPKTRLKLTLVGIVAASDARYSSVIIDHKGVQDSYFIDSKIDGTSAIITHIYPDRIILDVKGVAQALMLDGVDLFNKQQQNQEKKSKRAQKITSGKKKEVKIVNLDRRALLKNPGKLTDYIRISPVRENGVVKGYRVKPGKDKSLFKEAGFKSGDLAVELNGVDLTDTQQAFTLMKEFPTMTDMTLLVERDGQLHELYLSIP